MAARYIGRVGGLAVALGVGTALATGHGLALADTTDSNSSSNPSNSEGSSSGASAATGTTGTTTTSTGTETDPSEATASDDGQDTGNTDTTTTVTDEETVDPDTDTETPDESTPTETASPEPTETASPEPTETAEPTPTATAEPAPTGTAEPQPAHNRDSGPSATSSPDDADRAAASASPQAQTSTAASAPTTDSLADPASTVQEPVRVAVFADARALAAADAQNFASLAVQPTAPQAPVSPQNLFTAVTNVVYKTINWVLDSLAGNAPSSPAQPPLIWGLLAFARREFDNLFNALTGRSSAAPQTSTMPNLALAAAAVPTPAPPFPVQVSPSTQFVSWVTGPYVYPSATNPAVTDPLLANTLARYSVYGTDLGIMWDNGIPDDPSTPINEHQILIAVGDTFGGPNMQGDWRSNTIFRSSDTDLANGIEIPNGQWYTGNMFGGAPLGPDGYPTRARQVIFADGLPAGVTLIPTAGVSVPTPGSRFGAVQYVSFMSVTQWGAPGSWTTNYSAIAWSDDNGETFHVAPETVRYNQPWSGNQNFQQSAFVRPGDGYVYMYGTPNGRQGAAYLARVPEEHIMDLSQYEYWNKGSRGFLFGWGATPAGWHKNDPGAATPVFGEDRGACGVAKAGNQVSEMSVQYNQSLNKYVVLYGDQFNNIVMRTADTPQGSWSSATVLMPQQSGGIYAPMLHPWSPSTMGTGTDLYWNLSLWSSYNVMLMRTDLTKV